MTEPSPCPDCDATQTVTPCRIARRDGSRAVIELRETVHAATCPRRLGGVDVALGGGAR